MKHLNLELARLERRIAPGLTLPGLPSLCADGGVGVDSGGSGSSQRSNDGSSQSGSQSSKSHSNQGSHSS